MRVLTTRMAALAHADARSHVTYMDGHTDGRSHHTSHFFALDHTSLIITFIFCKIINCPAEITCPAFTSALIAIIVEVPLCLMLALWGARPFAFYLSQLDVVAKITAKMRKTIDWCYIFYALSTQLAIILLATQPRWYLYRFLMSKLLCPPVVHCIDSSQHNAR